VSWRPIVRFLLTLIVFWAALQFLVWPRAQPAYSAAVARVANGALAALERGDPVTQLAAAGPFIRVESELMEGEALAAMWDARTLHFYVVLFASIVLAFPGLGWRRRGVYLVCALAGLFLFHVVVLLINVEHMYAVTLEGVSRRNYSDAERAFWRWLHDTVDFFAVQVLPVLVLAVLVMTQGGFARRWFPVEAAEGPAAEGPAAEAPAAVPARRRLPSRRALAACGMAALVVLAGAVFTIQRGKVRARQAEKAVRLGYRALALKGFDQAAGQFNKALALRPGFPPAREGLGQMLLMQGQHEQAETVFRETIEKSPETADTAATHLHLGNALFGKADYAGAHAEYLKALELQPGHREALFNLAMVEKRLGRRDQAETRLKEVLKNNPRYAEALFELSVSMIATQRACGARPYLQKLVEVEPASQRSELARQTLQDLKGQCGGGG